MALPEQMSIILQGTNVSEVEVSVQETHPATSVLIQMIIMSVCSSLGLIGNIFAVGLLAASTETHVMSRYAIGRAVADILMLVTTPFDAATHFHGSWIFGTVLCKLRCALSLLAPFVSSMFQVGMCVNIYFEVSKPGPHVKLRSATFKIIAILSWSLFLMFGISIFIQSEILKEVASERLHCVSIPLMQDTSASLALRLLAICLIFLVPFVVSWVFVALNIPYKKYNVIYSSRQMGGGFLKAEKRLKQFLLAITVAFTVCQAPYWLPYLVLEFPRHVDAITSVMAVFPMTMSLPSINAVINFILYWIFIKDIQKMVEKMKGRITREQPMISLLPIT